MIYTNSANTTMKPKHVYKLNIKKILKFKLTILI